jgi:hypothetical protein
VSRLLEKLGHEVIVANAHRVKLISASSKKNDRRDAEFLARLARADLNSGRGSHLNRVAHLSEKLAYRPHPEFRPQNTRRSSAKDPPPVSRPGLFTDFIHMLTRLPVCTANQKASIW